MAGHSKWKNIAVRKGAQDKKRAKVFTKIIRDIITAVRSGGGDANANSSLRTVLDAARKNSMSKDVLDRAIKRGTGEIKGDDYSERIYEGRGPGSVAVIVKTLTDNPTRTAANIRSYFTKNGGSLGADGAVAWMFKYRGVLLFPATIGSEDAVMEAAIEAGAEDVKYHAGTEDEAGVYQIITAVSDFGTVKPVLEKRFGEAEEADLTYLPEQTQAVDDATAESLQKLIDALDADDDVQDVITNVA